MRPILLAICLFTVTAVSTSFPASAKDIYIDSEVIWENETREVRGDIIIGQNGTLVLINTTVIMRCTSPGQYRIQVKSGGKLIVSDLDGVPWNGDESVITSDKPDSPFLFMAQSGSHISMRNARISGVGIDTDFEELKKSGMYFEQSLVSIQYLNITRGYRGIIFIKCERSKVENLTVTATERSAIYLEDSRDIYFERVRTNASKYGIMAVRSNISVNASQIRARSKAISLRWSGILLTNSTIDASTQLDLNRTWVRLVNTRISLEHISIYPGSIIEVWNGIRVRVLRIDDPTTGLEDARVWIQNEGHIFADRTDASGYTHIIYVHDRTFNGSLKPIEHDTDITISYLGWSYTDVGVYTGVPRTVEYYQWQGWPCYISVYEGQGAYQIAGMSVSLSVIVRDVMNRTAEMGTVTFMITTEGLAGDASLAEDEMLRSIIIPISHGFANVTFRTDSMPGENEVSAFIENGEAVTFTITGVFLEASLTGERVGYVGVPITFDASSSRGTITSYLFDFGDSTSTGEITLSKVVHRYWTPGTYEVRVMVRDVHGLTHEAIMTVRILPPTKGREDHMALILNVILVFSIIVLIAYIAAYLYRKRHTGFRPEEIRIKDGSAKRPVLDRSRAVRWYNRGTEVARVDPVEALKCFNRALLYDPTYAKAHYNKGAVLMVLGRVEDARKSFIKALRYEPRLDKARKVLRTIRESME